MDDSFTEVPAVTRRPPGPPPMAPGEKRVLISAKIRPKVKIFLESLFSQLPGRKSVGQSIELLVKRYRSRAYRSQLKAGLESRRRRVVAKKLKPK